jgi:hypothetical protein
MENSTSHEDKEIIFDYKALRLMVGVIAFFLPWVVIVATWSVTSSISASYHTGVRDIFVGAMFVIGALLLAYNGHHPLLDATKIGGLWGWLGKFWKAALEFRRMERQYEERVISLIGGVAAIAAALCPTACDDCNADLKSLIHGISAGILFSAVVYFCLVGFLDRVRDALPMTWEEGGRRKLRAWIYLVCGWGIALIMLVALIAPFLLTVSVAKERAITFWAETAALWLFGIAWMTASKFLRFLVDKEEEQYKVVDIKKHGSNAKKQELQTSA